MCLIPSAGLDVSGSAVPTWSSAQRSAMFCCQGCAFSRDSKKKKQDGDDYYAKRSQKPMADITVGSHQIK